MASVRRRIGGRKPKVEDATETFIASLPDDKDWMAALRDEFEGESSVDLFDIGSVSGDTSAAVQAEEWASVHELLDAQREMLEEQREVILVLAAKVDALEESLAGLADRIPPVVFPPASRPSWPVREVVLAVRQQAEGVASRLRRSVGGLGEDQP